MKPTNNKSISITSRKYTQDPEVSSYFFNGDDKTIYIVVQNDLDGIFAVPRMELRVIGVEIGKSYILNKTIVNASKERFGSDYYFQIIEFTQGNEYIPFRHRKRRQFSGAAEDLKRAKIKGKKRGRMKKDVRSASKNYRPT